MTTGFPPWRNTFTIPPSLEHFCLVQLSRLTILFLSLLRNTMPLPLGPHSVWWELWSQLGFLFIVFLLFCFFFSVSYNIVKHIQIEFVILISSKIVFGFPYDPFACWGFLFIFLRHTQVVFVEGFLLWLPSCQKTSNMPVICVGVNYLTF